MRFVLFRADREADTVACNCDRTDIRKPATQKAQIQRTAASQSATNSGTPSEARSADLNQYTEPVSDDEEDDGNRHIAATTHEAAWADIDPQTAAEAREFREAQRKNQRIPVSGSSGENGDQGQQREQGAPRQSGSGSPGASSPKELFMKLTPNNLSKLVQSRYELERDSGLNEQQQGGSSDSRQNGGGPGVSLLPGRVEYVSSFRAQNGKRVAVPVRVEPKVFYANERTSESCLEPQDSSLELFRAIVLTESFLPPAALAWIEFSVVVSAIGIGIISFSDPHGARRIPQILVS